MRRPRSPWTWRRSNARVKALARAQSADVERRLDQEKVTVVHAAGRLDGPQTVVAERSGGADQRLDADVVLISTGAHPRVLPTATPDGERILTWEQVYDLMPTCRERLVVVGSGVTGAEFASAYNALGSRGRAGRPAATGCCPARTRMPPRCSRTSSPGAA